MNEILAQFKTQQWSTVKSLPIDVVWAQAEK